MVTLEQVRATIEPLVDQFGITKVGIFGSYARREASDCSDLDILISFNQKKQLDLIEFIQLKNIISDQLSIPVDLVEEEYLNQDLAPAVLQDVVYLYGER